MPTASRHTRQGLHPQLCLALRHGPLESLLCLSSSPSSASGSLVYFRCPPCSSGTRCVFSLRFVVFCLVALSCAPARPASLCPALSPFHPAFPRRSSVLPLPAVPYGGGRIAVTSVGCKVNCWIVGEMGRAEEEGRDPVDPENARFGFSVWRSREKNGHRREMAQGHEGSIPSCKHIELHR